MIGKRFLAVISTLCLCCGMLVTPFATLPTFGNEEPTVEVIEASAAESVNYNSLESTNGYYRFQNGARVGNIERNENGDVTMDLSFAMEIINTSHFTMGENDMYGYSFTLVRDSEQGQIPVSQYIVISEPTGGTVMHRQIISSNNSVSGTELIDNSISLDPPILNDDIMTGILYYGDDGIYFTGYVDGKTANGTKLLLRKYGAGESRYTSDGWVWDYQWYWNSNKPFYPKTKGLTFPTLYINVAVNSINASYFMVADFEIQKYIGTDTDKFLWWEETKIIYDENLQNLESIRSESRSCKQVLESINLAGKLEQEFPDEETRAIVNDILGNTTKQEITVKYLKQIGNAPFARSISSTVNIETYNDKVNYDDVCDAVGEKSLNCMGATVSHFDKNSMNVYEAVYLSSIGMKSATEDGHYEDYYIGLGQTFDEFVDDFNGDNIFDAGLFEYMLNDIHIAYPVTEGYEGDEIYGFWGCFVIPETMNMNTIWGQFFQIDPAITGVGKTYEVYGNVTVGEYWNLLGNYEYNWAQQIFQVVTYGTTQWLTFKAKYVMYYAKSYVTSGGYDESGGKNPGDQSGAIHDSINGSVDTIIDAFKDMQVENQNQTNETVRSVLVLVGAMFGLMVVGGVVVYVLMAKNKKK